MANIRDLTEASTISGGDLFPIDQGGSGRTRSVSYSVIKDDVTATVSGEVAIAVQAADEAKAAAASADATVLRAELADGVTVGDGAALVEYASGVSVRDKLDSLDAFDTDLQNPTDPAKGAAIVGRGAVAVNTIADLLLQKRESDKRYLVKSYSSASGLGGGEFYWDAASTEADDGGYTLAVSGVATGRFKRVDTGTTWIEEFGAVADATTIDGTTGTEQTTAVSNAINFCNANRRALHITATRRDGVIGYLVGDLPELSGGGVVLRGQGENCSYLVSLPTLTGPMLTISADGAGFRDMGLFCNDATRNPFDITSGYQPNIKNALVAGGNRGIVNSLGLEFRIQDAHVIDTADYGYYINRPDAILINASTDRAGTDGFRFDGHVVNTFHAHAIKSARMGFRATFATASQLIGDHADTSGYHGYQIDTCTGLRAIAPFSFKSGNANATAPGTYTDARNYSLTNNTGLVMVAPMSNQDSNCKNAFFGFGNTDSVLIAPIDTGTKPSVFDEGLQVVLAKGRLEKHNSLAIPKVKSGIIINDGASGIFDVSEPTEYSRAFNAIMYHGQIIVRLGTQNRILIGEFHIATGANTSFPSSIPVRWSTNNTSPDVSASLTITATYSTTGAQLSINNATGEAVAVGVSVQQIVSAKAV